MTLIAVKNGVMAADSGVFRGDMRMTLAPIDLKIVRAPDGSLVGACGSSVDCWRLREWVQAGMSLLMQPRLSYPQPDHDQAIDWLWLKPDGSLWRGDAAMNVHPLDPAQPTTIGCAPAWAFAESVMLAGYSAQAAVQHAITYCQNLSGPVQVERLARAAVPA